MYISFRVLNYEQQTAKGLVQEGHNAFITGKAGTGKTFLLSRLYHDLKTDAKTVSVTCTTGIACKSLPPALQATTLHSFAGIKDGSGSLTQLLEPIDGNPEAKGRWRTTDVLIIDEVSMLSEKIFNYIEYIARNVRQEIRAFGGTFTNCVKPKRPIFNKPGFNGQIDPRCLLPRTWRKHKLAYSLAI